MFQPDVRSALQAVHWLGHAGFLLQGQRLVYIDPYKVGGTEVGDAILVTHDHGTHCSPDDIKWLRKGSTVIVCPPSCASRFQGDVREVRPGDTLTIRGIAIEAVPAYNIGKAFHPREAGGVGYIVTLPEGLRVYHAGDTDLIPEMAQVRCDVALLPVSGTSTMGAAEAAEAANLIKPALAIPMHWGATVGSRQDADKFRALCKVEVKILKPES